MINTQQREREVEKVCIRDIVSFFCFSFAGFFYLFILFLASLLLIPPFIFLHTFSFLKTRRVRRCGPFKIIDVIVCL